MNNFKALMKGMGSIATPKNELSDVFKKYPSTFSRNDSDAIRQDWIKVGSDIKKGIEKYENSKK